MIPSSFPPTLPLQNFPEENISNSITSTEPYESSLDPDNDWVYVQHPQDRVDLLGFTLSEITPVTLEEIQDFFEEYVSRFCPHYTIDAVISLIDQGQTLLIAIKNNTAENIPYEQRRQWMSPLVWAFMFNAYKKKQTFEQGMFVFDDPDYRIVNFFKVVATKRPSSHFSKRREDSWGIDIEQNYKTGLPSGHQTAHFGRLKKDQKGQARSFLKPENWGMETWWQWLGHATDFVWTRVHNPTDEYKRKEHCPKTITNHFKLLYAELTHNSELPSDIETFGISGMVRFLMHYLETNPQNEQLYLIPAFIELLDRNYEDIGNLDRMGHEVILDQSLLFDELLISSSNSCDYKKFRAFLKLKTAKQPEEIINALKTLLECKQSVDWMPHPTLIPDNIAVYDTKGETKREAIFYQVNIDLERTNNEYESFLIDQRPFRGNAQDLFNELRIYIGDENHTLNAMTLMTQGVKEAMTHHMRTIMCSPIPDLDVTAYSGSPLDPSREIAKVNITISIPHIQIEIWQKYALRTTSCEKSTFREEPYAILKGWTTIYFPIDSHRLLEAFSYTKWAIDSI